MSKYSHNPAQDVGNDLRALSSQILSISCELQALSSLASDSKQQLGQLRFLSQNLHSLIEKSWTPSQSFCSQCSFNSNGLSEGLATRVPPEIWLEIFEQLFTDDMSANEMMEVGMTCWSWYYSVRSVALRDVTFSAKNHRRLRIYLEENQELVHLVRSVTLMVQDPRNFSRMSKEEVKSLNPFIPTLSSVTSFTVLGLNSLDDYPVTLPPSTEHLVLELSSLCSVYKSFPTAPRLRTLTLESRTFLLAADESDRAVLSSLPSTLEKFHIAELETTLQIWDFISKESICCDNITYLSIESRITDPGPPFPFLPKLIHLILKEGVPYRFMEIFKNLSNLKVLELHRVCWEGIDVSSENSQVKLQELAIFDGKTPFWLFKNILSASTKSLKRLHLGFRSFLSVEDYISFLKFFADCYVTFRFDNHFNNEFDHGILKAVIQNSRILSIIFSRGEHQLELWENSERLEYLGFYHRNYDRPFNNDSDFASLRTAILTENISRPQSYLPNLKGIMVPVEDHNSSFLHMLSVYKSSGYRKGTIETIDWTSLVEREKLKRENYLIPEPQRWREILREYFGNVPASQVKYSRF